MVTYLAIESPFKLAFEPLTNLHSSLHSTLYSHKLFKAHLYFLCLSPVIYHFSKVPQVVLVENSITWVTLIVTLFHLSEDITWVLHVLVVVRFFQTLHLFNKTFTWKYSCFSRNTMLLVNILDMSFGINGKTQSQLLLYLTNSFFLYCYCWHLQISPFPRTFSHLYSVPTMPLPLAITTLLSESMGYANMFLVNSFIFFHPLHPLPSGSC